MCPIPVDASYVEAMRYTLELARGAGECGEIPVGAVVLDESRNIIATGINTREKTGDPSGHAEINAIRQAIAKIRDTNPNERLLTGATIVVTMEPCVMCATAILMMRPARVIFGAWDDKAGGCGGAYDIIRDGKLPHPVPEVIGGVLADESALLLTDFFAAKRPD